MGVSISIQKCSVRDLYEELVNKFGEFTRFDIFELELKKFGEVHLDTFYVLENEYYNDCDSFTNVFRYLNEVYSLEDSFSVALPLFEECVGNVSLDEIDY